MSCTPTPYRMPYAGRRVPHLVIEVNNRCNIRCTACYKSKTGESKPLPQILQEVDQALQLRDLRVITLAGGEPTLHPELPEVIRAITARGVAVQLLTNGYDLPDGLLRRYADAGLKELFLHIDSLQQRADLAGGKREPELCRLRAEIATRVVASGIACSLAVTLYRATLPDLPELVRFTLTHPAITRLLVTCCGDLTGLREQFREGELLGTRQRAATAWPGGEGEDATLAAEAVGNQEVIARLRDSLGMEPFAYVASSRSLEEQRWIFYYSLTLHRPAREPALLHFGPAFGRVARFGYGLARVLGRPYSFADLLDEPRAAAYGVLHALAAASPRTLLQTARFLGGRLARGSRLQHKSLPFQQGPNLTPEGAIEYCRECPDATIRDGVLVPVCLGDLLTPA